MTYIPLDRDPEWKRSMEETKAKMNDCLALARGCSDHERFLRQFGTLFYHNDATFREIMIKLQVMNHRASLPWWAKR